MDNYRGKKIANPSSGKGGESADKLHQMTNLGYVHLNIADRQRSIEFYQRVIGLELIHESEDTVKLGVGNRVILALSEIPGASKYARHSGLYHFAILTPSRKALGRSLKNLIDSGADIQGGADHLVSEAIYLADPDGNGIEIYRDRAREAWEYENDQLTMKTDPLDYQGILDEVSGENGDWDGVAQGTILGHVHLHVADLEQATLFYEQVLGFDYIMNYAGSAAFLSAGGYHHHVGINTWNGVGAPPNPPDAVGLRYFTVNLVDEGEKGNMIERMERAEWSYNDRGKDILVRDPSKNGILLTINH